MTSEDFKKQCLRLIDDLKNVCRDIGLGNDGNEFKIITQVFLYKFLNDKFAYEVKEKQPQLARAKSWEKSLEAMSDGDYEFLLLQLNAGTAHLWPRHFISSLFEKQNNEGFAKTFDDTLVEIGQLNSEVFSVKTGAETKINLFERLSDYISDAGKRDAFCKALVNKIAKVSFERIFEQKYDFFATLFEYLISDYNKDGAGTYAEYYTPHAVSRIIAACLVHKSVQSVHCYDPSAGSGTLLMNLAHAIGESNCTIYSQDISQKSSNLLRLNLILNNLVHSIPNVVQGNTLTTPYHKDGKGRLMRFDYIVSNPPFKLDFSDWRDTVDDDRHKVRFFAGVPNVPGKAKDKMAIYLLFIQHIMYSLEPTQGKAAIVVPTGFITAQSGIDKAIRQALVKRRMLAGVVSMPSNIFATTGTNVSILFLDAANKEEVVLVDASSLGTKVKEGKNQKTVLSPAEEQRIIEVFNGKKAEDDFSVVVSYDEIAAKNYSLSAGQYFEVTIDYIDITPEAFSEQLSGYQQRLQSLFAEGRELEEEISEGLSKVKYD